MKPKLTLQHGSETLRIDSTDYDFPAVGDEIEIGPVTYRVNSITSAVVEVEPIAVVVTAQEQRALDEKAQTKQRVTERRADEESFRTKPAAKKK